MTEKYIKKSNSGYALLETLFYIALLAIFSIAIVNAIIVMTRSFKEVAIQSELMQGGAIMERMTREIKQAKSISIIGANDLKLNTEDSAGAAKTVEFLLSGANIQLLENDALSGNLNTSNLAVSNLTFTQIITLNGEAVKVSLTLSSSHDALSRAYDFYDTIALRGSY